jgi:negative regulator of flagellin synthesis FlgM
VQDQFNSAVSPDEANVSSTANAVAQALSGSDVRTDKVAALQQSIAAGTYSVPAADVAAKVLSALLH